MSSLSLADIQAAAEQIRGHAVRTPLLNFPVLDALLGGKVFFKPENLQRIGAFKFRGAYNRISRIEEQDRAAGVVACSSGNHAQGVAEAARLLGMPATIVMPEDAPKVKVAGTRAAGAQIVFYDREKEDREAIAQKICDESGATFIHPFNDYLIMAGQGTAALEAAEDLKARDITPDFALVPLSGGGLAAGFSTGVHGYFPDCAVWGCEPAGHDDVKASLAAGALCPAPETSGKSGLCDALLAPMPGVNSFPILQEHLAGSLVVSDEAVMKAIAYALRNLHLVVEPGGVVGLAALLDGQIKLEGRSCLIVLSGGNVDRDILEKALSLLD